MTEDDEQDIAMAEYKGRTERTAGFKIRRAHPIETMNDSPARYILSVEKGNMANLHAVSEADLTALGELLRAWPSIELPNGI